MLLFGKKKLLAAIMARDINRFAILLSRNPSLANAIVSFSWLGKKQRPLHLVAIGGDRWDKESILAGLLGGEFPHEHADVDLAMGRLLIKHGAIANCLDDDGETPLHYACGRGHQALAELLLDNGASLNYRDSLNAPALSFALQYGRDELATFLIGRGGGVELCSRQYAGRPGVSCLQARLSACTSRDDRYRRKHR